MCTINWGIDSFSYYYPLTPKQKSKIFEHLKERKAVRIEKSDYESCTYIYSSNCFKDNGIKILIHRTRGNPWGMVIIVHPLLVLGNSDRFSLYQPEKKGDYKKIVKRVDALLETIAVPCSIDKMKFFRIDVTTNLVFDDAFVMEYLRILKKSYLLPHYRLDWFREKEHKARNCKIANEHSFKQYCKSSAFFSYNKTAQLEMIDAFPSALIGKQVLRLEVQLRRKGMKKWIGKDGLDKSNWSILKNLWKCSPKILHWYIKRLQPICIQHIQYREAVRIIVEEIKGKKNRDRMLYLLQKTSDSNSLTTALEKMREKYGMSKGQQRTILKKFEKLGISPITLKNNSPYESLPSLDGLL